MKCPVCGSPLNQVVETRVRDTYVYRRRRCFNEHLFTTHEKPFQNNKHQDQKHERDC